MNSENGHIKTKPKVYKINEIPPISPKISNIP